MTGFNTQEQIEKIRSQLKLVQEHAPDVWREFLNSGICPYVFGLPCECGMEKGCPHCWEQAMTIDFNDEVKITPTGKFYCEVDNRFLTLEKTEDGSDFYICPVCKKRFEMQKGENNCIKKIISKGVKPPETATPTPDNPDYNEA